MLRVGGLAFLLGVLLVVCEGRKAGTFSPTLDPIWIERGKEYQEWYDRWFLSGTFSCEKNCTYDISGWAPTMTACTSNGNLVLNSLCSSRTTYVDCMSGFFLHNPQDEYSIVHPNSCACPSDCSNRGVCVFNGCKCQPGYTGVDCKTIVCDSGQNCNGKGKCGYMNDLGIHTCVCEDGYATNDCSSKMEKLPPITNLLGAEQYTSWDQYGDNHPIFNESTIAQIYITMDPNDLNDLVLPSNQLQRIYKPANFSFYSGPTTQRLDNIGIRVKGGSSSGFAKKSWKISFNHFVSGRKWAQMKKIDMKAAAMDPLFLRERSSFAAMRAMGGPVSRSSHATLYINGQYRGLYILLEEAGTSQFLKSRFGNDDGSLWKLNGGCRLKWVGNNSNAYVNNTTYEPMNNAAQGDYSPLINFLYILNNCPDWAFEEQIQTVLNVEFFLRTFTAEVMTANWDGAFDGNNYFLYYNTDTLFYYYRYDVDVSFGNTEDWFHGSTRDIWRWGNQGWGWRLINRILAVPSFQNIYADYLKKIITYVNWQQGGYFRERVEMMHGEITPPAVDDKWHSFDQMAYSKSDFLKNLNDPVIRPNIVPPQPVLTNSEITAFMALSEFVDTRIETIKQQLSAGPPLFTNKTK